MSVTFSKSTWLPGFKLSSMQQSMATSPVQARLLWLWLNDVGGKIKKLKFNFKPHKK